MKLKKVIYIVCGVLCVILGTIGVVVPGIPTTPFVLLASWLFYRSSERLRNWLLSSRLGKYAREYEQRFDRKRKNFCYCHDDSHVYHISCLFYSCVLGKNFSSHFRINWWYMCGVYCSYSQTTTF